MEKTPSSDSKRATNSMIQLVKTYARRLMLEKRPVRKVFLAKKNKKKDLDAVAFNFFEMW